MNGVGVSVSQRSTTDDVTSLCFLWSKANGDVDFTTRADESTAGSSWPQDLDRMLHTVHSTSFILLMPAYSFFAGGALAFSVCAAWLWL